MRVIDIVRVRDGGQRESRDQLQYSPQQLEFMAFQYLLAAVRNNVSARPAEKANDHNVKYATPSSTKSPA